MYYNDDFLVLDRFQKKKECFILFFQITWLNSVLFQELISSFTTSTIFSRRTRPVSWNEKDSLVLSTISSRTCLKLNEKPLLSRYVAMVKTFNSLPSHKGNSFILLTGLVKYISKPWRNFKTIKRLNCIVKIQSSIIYTYHESRYYNFDHFFFFNLQQIFSTIKTHLLNQNHNPRNINSYSIFFLEIFLKHFSTNSHK